MRTQGVFHRIEEAEGVETSFFTFEDKLAKRLHSRYYSATMDGPKDLRIAPEGLNYVTLLRHLAGDLATAREKLAAAEDRHMRVLARVLNLRQKRDELHPSLGSTFRKVRHTLENLYGSQRGFELAVISGPTPETAPRLVQQVAQTVDFLEEPEVDLPHTELKGASVDRATLAEDLKPGLTALQQVLLELKRTRKEAQGTRAEKQAAMKEFDRIFLLIAGTLENFFRLVGLDEAAERVRPKGRRGRPADGNGNGEEEAADEAAAETAAETESESTPEEAASGEATSEATDANPASQPATAPAPSDS